MQVIDICDLFMGSGFDSFKEWIDDKLKKFVYNCQGMGLKSKNQVPSLG